jgi:hypothetical protein
MDDIDYWLDLEEGLNEGVPGASSCVEDSRYYVLNTNELTHLSANIPGTVGNKRPLQQIDINASTTADPSNFGKRS